MASSLFGLEAELAVSGRKGQARIPVEHIAGALVEVAQRELTHLRGIGSRMFLDNGSLFYIDNGSHPEIATPECTTPWQAVAHLRSGERMVANLAALVRKARGLDEILVNRCNVDYMNGTTWGCHESYLTRLGIEHYENWVVPHIVSRLYTCSGGIEPLSPGIRFSFSPRVSHIDRIKSSDSTSNRGIFHTRDESLARSYHRLHILAGDNTCSQRSQLLKIGSTALVVALAESERKEPPLKLKNPLIAIKRFARDPQFRTEVQWLGRWRMMTALDIQRHYLERIEAGANTSRFPEWTAQFCQLWRTALEDVGRDPAVGPDGFDWTVKRALMSREIERSGFSWKTVDAWSDVLEALQGVMPVTEQRSGHQRLMQILRLCEPAQQPGSFTSEASEAFAARGLEWSKLGAFAALRQRLCEIDVRFGLVQDGIFDTLDRQGVLTAHRVVSEAEIAAATRDAPKDTRAHLRGQWVKRLASENGRHMCGWEGIRGDKDYLDLGDPFATEAEWKSGSHENDNEFDPIELLLRLPGRQRNHASRSGPSYCERREQAYNLYRRGRWADAEALLTHLLEAGFEPADTHCHLARLCLITERYAEAHDHVARAWVARGDAQAYVIARTVWLQLALLFVDPRDTPARDAGATSAPFLLGKLKTALQSAHVVQYWGMGPVLEHLQSRIANDQHALLEALVAAMSDRNQTSALEALESWQAQAPVPLRGTSLRTIDAL